jgi:hypothetical protein
MSGRTTPKALSMSLAARWSNCNRPAVMRCSTLTIAPWPPADIDAEIGRLEADYDAAESPGVKAALRKGHRTLGAAGDAVDRVTDRVRPAVVMGLGLPYFAADATVRAVGNSGHAGALTPRSRPAWHRRSQGRAQPRITFLNQRSATMSTTARLRLGDADELGQGRRAGVNPL